MPQQWLAPTIVGIALQGAAVHTFTLYNAVLDWTACTVLHFTALHCIALDCTALHCTVLHFTALHCTALYCTSLHCTALHCIALHCTALHWNVLDCTASKCTTLYSTALNWTEHYLTKTFIPIESLIGELLGWGAMLVQMVLGEYSGTSMRNKATIWRWIIWSTVLTSRNTS